MNSLAADSRRVGELRLKATRPELIRRGALKLEDALRTASVPSFGGSKKLIVRRVELGQFSASTSPVSLALRIEKELRRIRMTAVHALAPGAQYASAVVFQDAVEPCVELAARLIGGPPPSEWFWPLAVSGWQPSTPPYQALRICWRAALESSRPAASAAAVVLELSRRRLIDAALAALEPEDGTVLLRTAGWAANGPAKSPEITVNRKPATRLPVRDRALLKRWVLRWGKDDARSIWLAGVLLLGALPSIAVGGTFERFISEEILRSIEDSERPPPAQERREPNHDVRRSGTKQESDVQEPKRWPRQRGRLSEPPPHSKLAQGPDISSPETAIEAPSPSHVASQASHTALESAQPQQPARRNDTALTPPEAAAARTKIAPSRSSHAGLFFLVPVLGRLGLESFIEDHPQWAERDFPRRLLARVAERTGAPLWDPVCAAVSGEELPELPLQEDDSFVAPARWLTLTKRGCMVLARAGDDPPRRVLLDPSGRLPLANWRRRSPGVRALMAERRVRRGPALAPENSEDLLFRAWIEAARRWCRRYARASLTAIVRRQGHVECSRTHIDVSFRHEQADIRLRRAGLDLDPGWVPWLGRVVQFHYRNNEGPEHG